ncbi:MAG: N-acetyl-alpha-D-glucosaminyl L-malate synthase BshA [Saprospiraceae bacterium]|nr:N-acetyl-alpha-D-glucosaminyl L-malate synthase BshA [Saprospiraceae bacterium]
MKIGIVCYPTYGGSGVIATELGIGLAKRGHEIHFITYKRPARLSHFQANVFYHEVDTSSYPLFEYTTYDSALASKLVDVVKYENLDLLHVHYAIPHAMVSYIAKKVLLTEGRYVPTITTLHGTDITLVGQHRAFRPVVEFSMNKSDGLTAVSKSLRDQTYEYFNVNKEIEVVYNFIDFERFKKHDKDHFKKAIAPLGEPILTHVSNFRKVKRVDDVIRVFHEVRKEMPSKLLLIGDGPERRNAESLCRKLELCHDIRFLGKQDAIEELLAVSDLFIMPSAKESFGLAALEAMACEVPIISTNAGGLLEVNTHGQTGFLSEVGDVEDMARNALNLLRNPDLLSRFRENALQRAQEFDISNILPKYEAYYESVLRAAVYT